MYSRQNYRSLIDRALQHGYEFISFLDERDVYDRCIYLRHDVDYSLSIALELAKINHSLGVRGTFCLLLRSQIYNLLSHWALDHIREIQTLGQHVAMHYAVPPVLPHSDDELAVLVLEDFNILKRYISGLHPAFAWHNASRELMRRGLDLEVPGLINIYGREFIEDVPYFSDSNLRYSVAEFEEIIRPEQQPVLHLLLHPFNWVAGGSNMLEILAKTWRYVIRDREKEIGLNHVYQQVFPEGMPEYVLDNFSQQWLRAARQELK